MRFVGLRQLGRFCLQLTNLTNRATLFFGDALQVYRFFFLSLYLRVRRAILRDWGRDCKERTGAALLSRPFRFLLGENFTLLFS